jgi:hypothetical protein
VAPYHDDVARPRVVDGGDGLGYGGQLRISSRGQRTRSGPPAWRVGKGVTTPHRKNQLVTKSYAGPGNWTDSLERPRQQKIWTGCKWLGIGTSGGPV